MTTRRIHYGRRVLAEIRGANVLLNLSARLDESENFQFLEIMFN